MEKTLKNIQMTKVIKYNQDLNNESIGVIANSRFMLLNNLEIGHQIQINYSLYDNQLNE